MGISAVALADLGGSLRHMPLALTLALDDINSRYRRTVLGPLWIVIGQAATVAGFVVVFSVLFQRDPREYAQYLAAGFPVWALITAFLTDMPQTFIAARGFIESFELPWLTHIWRRTLNYGITFLHQILTLFVVMAWLGVAPSWTMLLAVPALLVLMLAGTGVGLALAVLGARYRDLQPAMTIVASFLFFFSPVVWSADQLRVNQWAVEYNPMHYIITLLRDPLLGTPPSADLWLYTTVGAFVAFALGFGVFYACRRRLYHWL